MWSIPSVLLDLLHEMAAAPDSRVAALPADVVRATVPFLGDYVVPRHGNAYERFPRPMHVYKSDIPITLSDFDSTPYADRFFSSWEEVAEVTLTAFLANEFDIDDAEVSAEGWLFNHGVGIADVDGADRYFAVRVLEASHSFYELQPIYNPAETSFENVPALAFTALTKDWDAPGHVRFEMVEILDPEVRKWMDRTPEIPLLETALEIAGMKVKSLHEFARARVHPRPSSRLYKNVVQSTFISRIKLLGIQGPTRPSYASMTQPELAGEWSRRGHPTPTGKLTAERYRRLLRLDDKTVQSSADAIPVLPWAFLRRLAKFRKLAATHKLDDMAPMTMRVTGKFQRRVYADGFQRIITKKHPQELTL